MNPLISVIVPVYKVEKYLDECVQSIINQTYRNLEIILVDDGSPDLCPAICDKYAEIDKRVVVIHKQNGGFCSARNAALSIAKGDYIGFVDSDDFIANTMYEELLSACQDNNVGLAYSNYFSVVNENINIVNCEEWSFSKAEIINYDILLQRLLKNQIFCVVWNKLFRVDLIRNIIFRTKNEDALFTFEVAIRMINQQINAVSVPSYLYYYRFNPFSFTHIRFSILTYIDTFENSSYFCRCLEKKSSADIEIIAKHRYYSHLVGLNMAIMNDYKTQNAYRSYSERLKEVPSTYVNNVFGYRHRLGFYILRFCPILWTVNSIKNFCTKKGLIPPVS